MDKIAFQKIKKEYNNFYNNLLRNGILPMRDTGRGFWGNAIADEVYEAFEKIGLQRFRSFVDLGSGDGKVVMIASLFCNYAVGIEIDPELHKKSMDMKQKLRIPNVSFLNHDFYDHNIAPFDLAFVYPDMPMHRGLEKKLLNELTGKLLHYGHHFHPENLNAEKKFIINGSLFTLYSNSGK